MNKWIFLAGILAFAAPGLLCTASGASSNFISGTVADVNNVPLANVSIAAGSATPVLTNSAGYYSIGGLNSSSYTVTPTLKGYGFSPVYNTITASSSNANFTAIPVTTPIFGMGFGPYLAGQSPGTPISAAQIQQRLAGIAPFIQWVYLYAISGGTDNLQTAPAIAKSLGLKTAVVAWLDTDVIANAANITALVAAVNAGDVDVAVVGSETLQRGNLTAAQLNAYITQVRSQTASAVPVTTADTFNCLLGNATVVSNCDVVFANIYPFYGNVTCGNATPILNNDFQQIKALAGSTPVYISETGWPSAGSANLASVPSSANASAYFEDVVSWAENTTDCAGCFIFEAYDEAWKAAASGNNYDAYWGIFDENGNLKPGMAPVFSGARFPAASTSGSPTISFTSIPASSADGTVWGAVSGVNPQACNVALYIEVAGLWYTKPTYATPLTPINYDGRWTSNVFTGTNDPTYTNIAAFVFPSNYTPTLVNGTPTLPAYLSGNALASFSGSYAQIVVSPVITTPPARAAVIAGANIAFAVAVSSNLTPAYQWQVSTDGGNTWNNVSGNADAGATTATLTITNATATQLGDQYRVVVTNSVGNTTTTPVPLVVGTSIAQLAWLQSTFTSAQLGDPAICGDLATPANDGIPNLIKYAFNLNPFLASQGSLPHPTVLAQNLTLTFPASKSDLTYTVQASTDLINWSTTDVNQTNGAQVMASYAIPTSMPVFLRIVVAPAP